MVDSAVGHNSTVKSVTKLKKWLKITQIQALFRNK